MNQYAGGGRRRTADPRRCQLRYVTPRPVSQIALLVAFSTRAKLQYSRMSTSPGKVFETSPASPDRSPREPNQSQSSAASHHTETSSNWTRNDIPSIYCCCSNCKKYYENRPITNVPEPAPEIRPRYNYLTFIDRMREAAARREQERIAKKEMAQKAKRREAERARLLASRERKRNEHHQDKRRKL